MRIILVVLVHELRVSAFHSMSCLWMARLQPKQNRKRCDVIGWLGVLGDWFFSVLTSSLPMLGELHIKFNSSIKGSPLFFTYLLGTEVGLALYDVYTPTLNSHLIEAILWDELSTFRCCTLHSTLYSDRAPVVITHEPCAHQLHWLVWFHNLVKQHYNLDVYTSAQNPCCAICSGPVVTSTGCLATPFKSIQICNKKNNAHSNRSEIYL